MVSFSCTSDDDSDIVGSWTLTSANLNCPEGSGIESQSIAAMNGCFSIEGDTQCMKAVFAEDGIATFEIEENGETFSGVFDYTFLNDNDLQLCFQNDPTECISMSLTATTLTWVSNIDECDTSFVFEKG